MVRRIGLIVACLAVAGPIRCCAFLPPWQNDIVHDNRRRALTADLNSASVDAITNNTALILSEVQTYQNPRYKRKPSVPPKPRGYWKSIDNLCKEFTLFWNELNVPIQEINPGEPPPIPSNFLLNFFVRNDLRQAFRSNGGREHVSYLLGGAKLIPPKWEDAVEFEEVKRLLPLMNTENANEEVPHQQASEYIEVEAIDRGGNEQLRLIDLVHQSSNHSDPAYNRKSSVPRNTRKPLGYWKSIDNIRKEFTLFWNELNVPIQEINPGEPPPIPSNFILVFFKRHDLRGVLLTNGGREHVSYLLGGAKLIPPKWKDAVELEEVKRLLPLMNNENANEEVPHQQATESIEVEAKDRGGNEQLRLIDLVRDPVVKRSKTWTKERTVLELYRYLENYEKYKQRPSVWMPQLTELSHEGYAQLYNRCSRFSKLPCASVYITAPKDGGVKDVAGLVSCKEWMYFDSQLQLFVELKKYLNAYHNGSEEVFPSPLDVKKNGYSNLYNLICIHGGKVFLSQKLGMKLYHGETKDETDINWGPITLDFAIRLLHFIRSKFMTMSPPLSYPMISMPLEQDLLVHGQDDLAKLVIKFGGYENIARRLGLAYFDRENQQIDEIIFKGAEYLWKQRNATDTSKVISAPPSQLIPKTIRKTKGVVWTKNVVVSELHAYVKANNAKRGLSPVWMPRFAQFNEDGRFKIRCQIVKYGGQAQICKAAGLIPYSTWTKFESFRQLLKELLKFNDEVTTSKKSDTYIIPTPKQISKRRGGCNLLSELIIKFGRRRAVQDLLLIHGQHRTSNLSMLVELTEFIHSDMMSSEPPYSHDIPMPTRGHLLREKREDLASEIYDNDEGLLTHVVRILPGVQLSV